MNTCYGCGEEISLDDKFCRHCGIEAPAKGMSWDWRDQPNFSRLNKLLAPYNCQIIEIETGTDQHSIKVESTRLK